MTSRHYLPQPLRHLVHETTALLGDVIREQCGKNTFEKIEAIRQQMLVYRQASNNQKEVILEQLFQQLSNESCQKQHIIAHSYNLMLELINGCENAYRTYRLSQGMLTVEEECSPKQIIFVFTAHPTEARSPQNINLFQQIQACCTEQLKRPSKATMMHIKHLLSLAWQIPVAKHLRPTVEDEAKHIFSILLQPNIINTLLTISQYQVDIRIRTWVGGDKDGHPGVNDKVMFNVMGIARRQLITIIETKLKILSNDIKLLANRQKHLQDKILSCRHALKALKKIQKNDSHHIKSFINELKYLQNEYLSRVGVQHPSLNEINDMLAMFPGLIIPLELREDSKEIHKALVSPTIKPIANMLLSIGQLCTNNSPEYYAKGLIISMTETIDDIEAACKLVDKMLNKKSLRVVPLFETEEALHNAPSIIHQLLKKSSFLNRVKKTWQNKFEIMLGYSDSAKSMGALSSRLAIMNCLQQLDTILKTYDITPIYFHGSGGSVDRGGGSIEEQTAWWPTSALAIYKTTIQGEMVERAFATSEIAQSMINKLNVCKLKTKTSQLKLNKATQQFAELTKTHYQRQQQDPLFLKAVQQATSYSYLNKLKIGSRPSKRTSVISADSLRAIPWVLCWTQTRVLFPTWWGIGYAWNRLKHSQSSLQQLKSAYRNNPLFHSFIKLLGFTLSKVDLHVWHMYLKQSALSEDEVSSIYQQFTQEYLDAKDCVTYLTEQSCLLWFRPWLQESIHLRSPMINPLNLLQIIAMKNNDDYLLRETTTGIASGMLTTG